MSVDNSYIIIPQFDEFYSLPCSGKCQKCMSCLSVKLSSAVLDIGRIAVYIWWGSVQVLKKKLE